MGCWIGWLGFQTDVSASDCKVGVLRSALLRAKIPNVELELLDQLLASDEPLRIAWLVFDVDHTPTNLDRARRAIRLQVKEGLLEVVFKSNSPERVLRDWEVEQVLENEENWLASRAEAKHHLRITNAEARLVS